jgi:NADPH:quinone reductase-like Zn-dependent oxidoreductase
MKAIQANDYGGEEQLKLVDVPQPKPERNQALVRVFAATYNPIDSKLLSGNMRQMMPLKFPWIPGCDFSGVVDSVGDGVPQFRAGDEVWGYVRGGGTYAEHIAVDADKIAHKPKNLSHLEAASLGLAGQTALQAIDRANVQQGQTVLIHGASGAVGSVAVQEAHRRGATVIAVAKSSSAERLKSYGANEIIDYEKTPFEKSVQKVDVVLDAVGGDVLQRSYGVLKPGGVLVSMVQPPSEQEANKYHITATVLVTEPSSGTLHKLGDLVDSGQIKPLIGKVYPISEVVNAWREYRAQHSEGKLAFKIAAEADQRPSPRTSAASR